MPTLNALANILKNNPELVIRLGSHTDCQGKDEYNLDLSQRRAEAAREFLISKGIDPARLKSQGYGKTRLIMTCDCNDCTDEQHQTNRRTTFEILE
ncbi:UNVERIFIED_CONTAM: hypothetical protein GTU68_030551 [Idotea baltica]|nr:hypothetical protein [Idotea baltica]